MPPPLPTPPGRPPTRGVEGQNADALKLEVARLDAEIHANQVYTYALILHRQDLLVEIEKTDPDFF